MWKRVDVFFITHAVLMYYLGLIECFTHSGRNCVYISSWSHCSSSCGTGIKVRALSCFSPEINSNVSWYKIKKCVNYHVECYLSKNKNFGLNKRKKILDNCRKLGICQGEWSHWSKCSNDCGNGLMRREWTGGTDNFPIYANFTLKICVGQSPECTRNFMRARDFERNLAKDKDLILKATMIAVVIILVVTFFIVTVWYVNQKISNKNGREYS